MDRLPPHSVEAEAGLLGCALWDAAAVVPEVEAKRGGEEVFYDLRHQAVWGVIAGLVAEGKPVDSITVVDGLRSEGLAESSGGWNYLSGCMELVPSALNWPHYFEIVWTKFLARRHIAVAGRMAGELMVRGEINEADIGRFSREWEGLQVLSTRMARVRPVHLKRPSEFEAEYEQEWFYRKIDEFGMELPWTFPWRIRPSEATLVFGDSGSGKSTMLSHVMVNCARQKAKVVVASMEEPAAKTLKLMARQILGLGRLPQNDEGYRKAASALAWLESRVTIYDFLGITNWVELLDSFRYARAHELGDVFVLDSVMRIGIPDDDYAQQGTAAAAFANFAVKTGAHLFYVMHENKGEGKGKGRIRGSKQWSDNASNVLEFERNMKKGEQVDTLRAEAHAKEITWEEFHRRLAHPDLFNTPDAKFWLRKQREKGGQQNGARALWFDRESQRFFDKPGANDRSWLGIQAPVVVEERKAA